MRNMMTLVPQDAEFPKLGIRKVWFDMSMPLYVYNMYCNDSLVDRQCTTMDGMDFKSIENFMNTWWTKWQKVIERSDPPAPWRCEHKDTGRCITKLGSYVAFYIVQERRWISILTMTEPITVICPRASCIVDVWHESIKNSLKSPLPKQHNIHDGCCRSCWKSEKKNYTAIKFYFFSIPIN